MRAFSVDDEIPPFDASYGKTLNDAVFASRGSVLNRSATMRVIDAGSLTLEPQIAARAEAMFLVLNDPAIYAHENGPPASVERLRERFAELEERQSPDRREKWLNWVIRLPNSELIGYV